MKLPIGKSDFKSVIKGDYDFIDKTLLIKDIIDNGAEVILIVRPRRFGKTLNLSMLKYFFMQADEDIFAGLNISKEVEFCQKHQNKYPVIFISFKDVKQHSFVESYANIIMLISELYETHSYLLEGDLLSNNEKNIFNDIVNERAKQSHIANSLLQLSGYLERKFQQKPIILIDEYDTPIHSAYEHNYYAEIIELMQGLLGKTLKDNNYLEKAVLTGITRVSQESLFSGLNNVQVYSFLNEEFGQYFGFTEDEVMSLIAKSEDNIDPKLIKEWYNGYSAGKHTLYNPWSILECLSNKGFLAPYWLNTSSNHLVKELISKANLDAKAQLESLLQGQPVYQEIKRSGLSFLEVGKTTDALWSLLFYTGYLKIDSSEMRNDKLISRVSIPNKEIKIIYNEIIENWFQKTTTLASYEEFIHSLETGDMETFKRNVIVYMEQSGSYFDFNSNTPEQVFHGFVLGMVVGLRGNYIIKSNQEAGFGRYDVAILPKHKNQNGILIEFKAADKVEDLQMKANEGLTQIKNKKYTAIFADDVPEILVICMAFCGKKLEILHEYLRIGN